MLMRRRWLPVFGILVISFTSLVVVWPGDPDRYLPSVIPWPDGKGVSIGSFERREMRLGLDLLGGTRLLLEGTIAPGDEGDIEDAIEGTIDVLRRRVDASGLGETEIARQGDTRISIQLPGMTPEEARRLLGRTAQLRFCQSPDEIQPIEGENCDTEGMWVQAYGVVDGRPMALTGGFLKANSYVSTDQLGNPAVAFEWRDEGPDLSEQITRRLLNRPLGIFLDDELLSSPIVNAVISESGVITGMSLDRARMLVVQLNSGALPLELTVLQEHSVDATLGGDSVRRSVLAGEIGFLLVILFMILYYRVPGLLAAAALISYALLTMAIYKLIPVTLTLAGIGAFVLSVGMAVDANILIFERMKEELRSGRSYATAVEAGFRRAWPSIRDSNVATLITTAILFVLGGGVELPMMGTFHAPLVQSFAVTLAIGVLISMFSAVTVTRSLLRLIVGSPLSRRHEWLSADARHSNDHASAGADL